MSSSEHLQTIKDQGEERFWFWWTKKKKKKSEHTLGDAVCLSLVKEGTEGRRSGTRDTQPVSVCTEGDPSRDTHSPAETCREGPR